MVDNSLAIDGTIPLTNIHQYIPQRIVNKTNSAQNLPVDREMTQHLSSDVNYGSINLKSSPIEINNNQTNAVVNTSLLGNNATYNNVNHINCENNLNNNVSIHQANYQVRDNQSKTNTSVPIMSYPVTNRNTISSVDDNRSYDRMTLKWAAQTQIEHLIEWAKFVPRFTDLLIDDQVTLLKTYWNELLISEIAFKSVDYFVRTPNRERCLCIGHNLAINEDQAHEIGLGSVFNRILDEIVAKMFDMKTDSTELACLRAIILLNPETQGLKSSQPIENLRSKVYNALEKFCKDNHKDQPNRFGKLLLRLPSLRSIGLKCDARRSDNTVVDQQPVASCYQVRLLFFNICYELSNIDSFLRSCLVK